MNDTQLLENFAGNGSETAFRTLVERHLPLVLGTARRMTGDSALAEDVAQTVFILLARKARGFGSGIILSGWLYRTTRFVAARALTSEQRRRRREEEAANMHFDQAAPDPVWQQITPQLDEALGKLGETDRNALLLRFFNQQPMRDVGVALGLSEEAAKKRVGRALEKLRTLLSRRGTEISVAALIAGLSFEAKASIAAEVANKISRAAIVQTAAGAGIATTSSALLTDVLSALRWAKIKLSLGIVTAVIATVVLVPTLTKNLRHTPPPVAQTQSNALANAKLHSSKRSASNSNASMSNDGTVTFRPLRITVLDSQTGAPIVGARAEHSFNISIDGKSAPDGNLTDSNGVVTVQVPQYNLAQLPKFGVTVIAADYAPREISWLSSTGFVMSLVSTQYTVRLEHGITLAGQVVNDAGEPLSGVRVGASGSNYRGYSTTTTNGKVISPPVIRKEDFATFDVSAEEKEPHPIVTDSSGHFRLTHYPSDLHALLIELIAADGSRRKFRTPTGERLTSDETVEVGFEELKNGTARLILPRGFPVNGIVVNNAGEPIAGAEVIEASQWGNLKVLSRHTTDASGTFHLENRPARELIFAAKAAKYASASVVARVRAGMETVRLQLSSQLPLRGRVVDEAGNPLQGYIQVLDYQNEGLGFQWQSKTSSDGRFVWEGAPTNELAYALNSTDGAFKSRILRLRASTNEQTIVIHHEGEFIHIRGKVVDAGTHEPLEGFQLKINHEQNGSFSDVEDDRLQLAGNTFDITVKASDYGPGWMPVYELHVEAKGYETATTRSYMYDEGDQDLEIALKHGGTIHGTILTPEGAPAVRAQVEMASKNNEVEAREDGTLRQYREQGGSRADQSGHYQLKKQPDATAIVVFHNSGWAIIPVAENQSEINITLQPFGRIEGTVMHGNTPGADEEVHLENLIWDFRYPLRCLYEAKTDHDGHFVFEKLAAHEYKVAQFTQNTASKRNEYISTMQTPVEVRAGETTTVTLGSAGSTVAARLRAPASLSKLNWTNSFALLRRDVSVPPQPPRSDFVSNASHTAARIAQVHDPEFIAVSREVRDYLGRVTEDGVVSFDNIPAGNYILDVMLYPPAPKKKKKNRSDEELLPIAQLKVAVTVPETTNGAQNNNEVSLGTFTIEPL